MNEARQAARMAGIDARTHARRIAGYQARQRAAGMPPARRAARLAFLQQLTGDIDAGFTNAALREAQAALAESSRQPSLPWGNHGAAIPD